MVTKLEVSLAKPSLDNKLNHVGCMKPDGDVYTMLCGLKFDGSNRDDSITVNCVVCVDLEGKQFCPKGGACDC